VTLISEALWAGAATAAGPALRVVLWRRTRTGKEIGLRIAERRGIDNTPRPDGKILWLHAASVGEAMSALPVLSALPRDVFTVFTTGTVTSAKLLESRLPLLGLSGRVVHRFAPLDVPSWVARFLDHWRPDTACFLESELWPNMLAACRRRGIPAALINARLSRSSARSWGRAPGLARRVLSSFTRIAAQSEADAERLRALGARQVEARGNLKYAAPALPADPAELDRLAALIGGRPRWLAASTHPADDAVVARVHRALKPRFPDLLTAVAPRHPERGAAVAAVMGDAKRRALHEDPLPEDPVWIADTVGEMGLLYRLFPTVFMGKSFAGGGGQNFLEPARLGCAVATGPRTDNFSEAREMAVAAGALHVVADEEALIDWLDLRLRNPRPAREFDPGGDLPLYLARMLTALLDQRPMGKPDAAAIEGTTETVGDAVKNPPAPGQPAFWQHGTESLVPPLLAPLSPVVAGVTARRVARRGWRAPVPVICCGNAVVGGAGKTTLALHVMGLLRAKGLDAHALTRGYRGRAQGVLRVDPTTHGAAEVGDEALLLAAFSPTWRGADRAESAARAVEAGAQVLVMDDGLQNPTLQKTLSFLVVDGGFGFGNGRVLPAGPLREPVRAAAARSDAAVLIGKDETHACAQLPAQLPVLRARLVPAPEIAALQGKVALAFAGIGRPEKFFAMLEDAGVHLVERVPFPDHHPFTEADIGTLLRRARAAGAVAVTTPKDAVRLPVKLRAHVVTIGVGLVFEDPPALDALLDQCLKAPAFR
jgi:3-deoxy-D-manno-octulosonic-acid transferase